MYRIPTQFETLVVGSHDASRLNGKMSLNRQTMEIAYFPFTANLTHNHHKQYALRALYDDMNECFSSSVYMCVRMKYSLACISSSHSICKHQILHALTKSLLLSCIGLSLPSSSSFDIIIIGSSITYMHAIKKIAKNGGCFQRFGFTASKAFLNEKSASSAILHYISVGCL